MSSERQAALAGLAAVGLEGDERLPCVALGVGPDVAKAHNYARALRTCGLRVLPIDTTWEGDDVPASLSRDHVLGLPVQGLVLTGGGDIDPDLQGDGAADRAEVVGSCLTGVLPKRDTCEQGWFLWAWERRLPVLGICRGMQVMNWSLGGTLWLDIDLEYTPLPARLTPGASHPLEDLHAVAATSTGGPARGLGHRQIDRGLSKSEVGHLVLWEADSLMAHYHGEATTGVNSDHHQALRSVARSLRVTGRAPDGIIEAVEARDRFAVGVQFHPELLWEQDTKHLAAFRALADAVRGNLPLLGTARALPT